MRAPGFVNFINEGISQNKIGIGEYPIPTHNDCLSPIISRV